MRQIKPWAITLLLVGALVFTGCSHSEDNVPAKSNISSLQLCQIKSVVDSYPNTKDTNMSLDVAPTGLVSAGDFAWVSATSEVVGTFDSLKHGIVRKTDNGGSHWTTIDDSTGPKNTGAANRAIARGSDGTLYVVQNTSDGINLHYTADEKKWNDVSYSDSSTNPLNATSVAISPDQTVYISVVSGTDGKKKSLVLVKPSIQNQFDVLDTLNNAEIKQILIKSDGSLLEVGALYDDSGSSTWRVRSSAIIKSKMEFTQSDKDFPSVLTPGDKAQLNAIFPAIIPKAAANVITPPAPILKGTATAAYIDANKLIYVAGEVNDGQIKAWSVQESADGQQFFLMDAYHVKDTHKEAVPKAFFSHEGRPTLVGGTHDTKGFGAWNVRYKVTNPLPTPHTIWLELTSVQLSTIADDASQAVGGFTNSLGQMVLVGDVKDQGVRTLKTMLLANCPSYKH
jgi:hypothetical protein